MSAETPTRLLARLIGEHGEVMNRLTAVREKYPWPDVRCRVEQLELEVNDLRAEINWVRTRLET